MKKLILILAVAALPMAVYADTPAKTTTKKHAHKHTTAASPAPDASPSPEAGTMAGTAAKKAAPAAKATPAPKASPSPAAK
jgi:DNA-binding protein HU-beta